MTTIVNRLAVALEKISLRSRRIMIETLPIMKELTSPINDLVEDVLDECKAKSEEKEDVEIPEMGVVLEVLRDILQDAVKDARQIQREIESFSESVIQGEDAVDEGEDEFPFLYQVWRGDIYGEPGIEGLEILADDLKEQLGKCNEDHFVDLACERFIGEEYSEE